MWTRYVKGAPENLNSRFLADDTDDRSLIVRVLAAAGRASSAGVMGDEVVDFLEASFGAFQARRSSAQWQWSRPDLLRALSELTQHGLVEAKPNGAYQLTQLGRLAGESATEVSSIIRLVDCLRPLQPGEITDQALIAAVQMTREVDQVLFPINKRSTQKEPQVWPIELRKQGVSEQAFRCLPARCDGQPPANSSRQESRCMLLFVSGQSMNEVETILTQFGGAFGGAAGPIRAVASRTCDLIPVAARVAEILKPTLDLNDRVGRLVIRLTYGVAAPAVDLAREAGANLLRGDYQRLTAAGLCEPERIEQAQDKALLDCLDNDRKPENDARPRSRKAHY